MPSRSPISKLAVKRSEAARLLSLTMAEFSELVDANVLPRPEIVGGKYERWPVARLEAVLTGANIAEEFEP